ALTPHLLYLLPVFVFLSFSVLRQSHDQLLKVFIPGLLANLSLIICVLSQTGNLKQRNRMQTLKACFTEINQSATMGKQGRDHRTGEQHFLLITNNYTQRQRKKPKAYIGAQ